MSYCKSLLKAALVAGIFFSNSLLANQVLISDQNEINYSLIESHLVYGYEPNDKSSTLLEINTSSENHFKQVLPPLYEDKKVLFKLSPKGIREQQKNAKINNHIIDFNDNLEIDTDSYISLIVKVTF